MIESTPESTDKEPMSERNGNGRTLWERNLAVLITILIAVLGFGVSVLVDTRRMTSETRDIVLRQEERMATLRRDLDKATNDISTVKDAYQWNVNYRLTRVEAANGIKPDSPPQRPPQKEIN